MSDVFHPSTLVSLSSALTSTVKQYAATPQLPRQLIQALAETLPPASSAALYTMAEQSIACIAAHGVGILVDEGLSAESIQQVIEDYHSDEVVPRRIVLHADGGMLHVQPFSLVKGDEPDYLIAVYCAEDESEAYVAAALGIASGIFELALGPLQSAAQDDFAGLVAASPNILMVTGADGTIEYVNEAFVKKTGFTADEAIGQNITFLQPEDQGIYLIIPAIEAGRTWRGDVQQQTKHSQHFIAATTVTPFDGAEGQRFLIDQEDVTIRRRVAAEQQQLSQIIELTNDFVAMADAAHNIVYINAAGLQMMGYTAQELAEGLSISDFQEVTPEMAASLEGADFWQGETTFRHRDGSEIIVSQVISVIRNNFGDIEALTTITRDITEQKRAITETQALNKQIVRSLERRSQEVAVSVEVGQEIAAAEDLDTLFERVVTLVKERFGYLHAQIFTYHVESQSMRLVKGYGERGAKMLKDGHALMLERGVVGTAAATGRAVLASDVANDPDWIPHPDLPETQGELAVPISLRGETLGILDVQSDTAGALTEEDQLLLQGLGGQIAIAMESTFLLAERARSEQRLSEERNMLRTLIDNVPEHIFVKDRESNFILNNLTHARDVLGVEDMEDAVGKNDFEFFPNDLAQRYFNDEQALMEADSGFVDQEYPSTNAAGEQTWHLDTKLPLHDADGNVIGLMGITRDITALKLREQERENLLVTEREQRGFAELMADVSMQLSALTSADEMLDAIIAYVRQFVPQCSNAAIGMLTGQAIRIERLWVHEDAHVSSVTAGTAVPLASLAQTAQALSAGKPYVRTNTTPKEDPGLWALDVPWVKSYMVLPVIMRGTMLGVVFVGSDDAFALGHEDAERLQPLVNASAIALENVRLLEDAQSRARREERVNVISTQMQTQNDMNSLLNIALQELGTTLGARVGRIRLTLPSDEAPPEVPPHGEYRAQTEEGQA